MIGFFFEPFLSGQPAPEPVLHHHGASGDHHRVVRDQHAPADKGDIPSKKKLSFTHSRPAGDERLP